MEKLYKSLTKLPDIEKEILQAKGDGKVIKKTKLVTDRYLLTLKDGNSVALTKESLKNFGISVADINENKKINENSLKDDKNPKQIEQNSEENSEENDKTGK